MGYYRERCEEYITALEDIAQANSIADVRAIAYRVLNPDIADNLDSIIQSFEEENVSYSEIAELEESKEIVKILYPHDCRVWEWAGIPEDEWENKE
jgi:hypothetical protein